MAPLSLKVVQDNGAVTRTVKVESKATVEDALHTVLEKFMIPDDGKAYGLFLTSADNDRSGVWLESFRLVEYYMLRDGDTLLLLCKTRNLRLKMLDGSVKTLQVDESQPISQMMIGICARIGITNHDEYGLCYENNDEDAEPKVTSTGTLTLKRPPHSREKDAKLEHMSKKLKTDDNVQWLDMHRTLREMEVGPNDTLLLKRRLFYTDRNVDARDPVQLNLLYVQTRDAILCGQHPVTVDQAADCKLRWINIRDVNRRILRKKLVTPDSRGRLYKYESELAFMRPFYRDVNIQGCEFESDDKSEHVWNDDDDATHDVEVPHDIQNDSDEVEKPVKKEVKTRKKSAKRKKRKTYEEEEDEDELPMECSVNETAQEGFDPTDPVDAFLISIGATLKTFSPYHLNLAKSKIFSVVQEHDLQQIVQKSSDVSVKQPETLYLSDGNKFS